MRFSTGLLSIAFVCLAFSACNDDPPFYLFSCTTSADCTSGAVCEDNVCVTPDNTGGDAGGTDATTDDTTSPVDADNDTSSTDVTAPDTSQPDMGTPDMGTPDMGAPDTVCTPQCGDRECGSDGCGGVCGTCSGGASCNDGQCIATETIGCGDLVNCLQLCEDQTCADGCGARSDEQSINLYIQAIECVQENCGEITNEEEALACQSDFCSNELNACFAD